MVFGCVAERKRKPNGALHGKYCSSCHSKRYRLQAALKEEAAVDGNSAPVANAPAPGPQLAPAASSLEQQLPTLLTQAAQAGVALFEMQRSAAPPQPPPQSPEHPPHESFPSVAGAHLPLGARLEAELGHIDAERSPFPTMRARVRHNRNGSLSTNFTAGSVHKPPSSSEQLAHERTGELAVASLFAPGPARQSHATLKKKLDGISRAQRNLPPCQSMSTESPMPCHTPRIRHHMFRLAADPTCRRVGRHRHQPGRLLVRSNSRAPLAPRHRGRPSRCARRSPVRAES